MLQASATRVAGVVLAETYRHMLHCSPWSHDIDSNKLWGGRIPAPKHKGATVLSIVGLAPRDPKSCAMPHRQNTVFVGFRGFYVLGGNV